MEIAIRPATNADAEACGRICYEGFRVVTDRHGYPPVFASVEVATRRLAAFIANPSVFGLVAELRSERRIAGFNFLSERDPIRAIGPIAVDPSLHGYGIGRSLMQAALDRARGAPGVRLVQPCRSMPHSDSTHGSSTRLLPGRPLRVRLLPAGRFGRCARAIFRPARRYSCACWAIRALTSCARPWRPAPRWRRFARGVCAPTQACRPAGRRITPWPRPMKTCKRCCLGRHRCGRSR